jgi:hypothetical protein
MIELDKLRDQLLATLKGGQDPSPVTTTTTTVVPHKPPVKPENNHDDLKMAGSIGAGALTGQQLAKKAGFGGVGQTVAGVTGGAVGGLIRQATKEDAIVYKSSIAQSLTESFGYDFEEQQLDEYSLDQFGKDAGDFGRGAWNGVTLGTGDNIAAGVQSAFGKDTYKQALARQTAASKEAEERSPWLYGAGNVAGSLAVPIPGGAVAGALVKGAGKAATIGRGAVALGTNIAAQKAVDTVKAKADTATLGYDPNKYPTTPQAIMAFQKANGLAADGKIGPKTQAVLAKMGLKPEAAPTAAESIQSLRDRLAMIESQPQTQVIRVWLTPENLVFTDDGEQITDSTLLENIQWPKELLAEKDLKQLAIGKGADELEKFGSHLPSWLGGGKTGTKVASKEFVRSPASNQMVKNKNLAHAELPGAPKVAGDPAMGSVGQKVAQGRADAAFEKGRADSAALQNTMNSFTSGGVASRAAAEADAAKQAALKARLASGNGITKQTTGISTLASKEAGLAGKEVNALSKEVGAGEKAAATALTDAEKAAAAAEAKAASKTGKLKDWIKANPGKATALGLLTAAGVALGINALGGDGGGEVSDTGSTGVPHTGGGGTTGGDPSPSGTTTGELTPEQKEIIAKMQKIIAGVGATEDEGLLSHIAPANDAIQKATQSVGGKAKGTPAAKVAAGTPQDGPGLAPKPGQLDIADHGDPKTESVDAELARWLKIARG